MIRRRGIGSWQSIEDEHPLTKILNLRKGSRQIYLVVGKCHHATLG